MPVTCDRLTAGCVIGKKNRQISTRVCLHRRWVTLTSQSERSPSLVVQTQRKVREEKSPKLLYAKGRRILARLSNVARHSPTDLNACVRDIRFNGVSPRSWKPGCLRGVTDVFTQSDECRLTLGDERRGRAPRLRALRGVKREEVPSSKSNQKTTPTEMLRSTINSSRSHNCFLECLATTCQNLSYRTDRLSHTEIQLSYKNGVSGYCFHVSGCDTACQIPEATCPTKSLSPLK